MRFCRAADTLRRFYIFCATPASKYACMVYAASKWIAEDLQALLDFGKNVYLLGAA